MVKMGGLSLKQKPIKLTIMIILVLTLSASITFPLEAAAQTDGYYDKSFAWDYNGQHWTWNLSIPVDLYNAYKSVPSFHSNKRWTGRLRFLHHNQRCLRTNLG